MENKILDFEALRSAAAELGQEAVYTVNRFKARYARRALKSRSWLVTTLNPWGEVRRLQNFVDAMRAEEHVAARSALDLYAENESLRRYKDLCIHGPGSFVAADDHKALQRRLVDTEQKLAGAQKALSHMEGAWKSCLAESQTGDRIHILRPKS